MKIEVVAFYPNKKQKPGKICGTAHVYLCDLDIDMRGVMVHRKKKAVWVQVPHAKGWDSETRKMGSYPVFNFVSKERQKDLVKSLQKAIYEYFEKEMK